MIGAIEPRRVGRSFALAALLWLSVAVAGFAEAPSESSGVWNALDHGARRGADVTDVLEAGLSTQRDHGLPVFLPGGVYYLDRPLRLPSVDGVVLRGVGPGHPRTGRGHYRGASTRLIYRGPPDEPAITNTATRFALSGLTLQGRPDGESGDRPRIGYLMVRRGPGLGVGKAATSRVNFVGFETAIQLGETPWQGNADTSLWDDVGFFGCGEAVRFVNHMAMGHHFRKLFAHDTPTVFAVAGGGDLHVTDALVFDTTLFRFTADNPRRARSGANNGTFTVTNLKVDAQHRGRFTLLDGEAPSNAHVIARSVRVSGANEFVLARLAPGHRLTLRDVDGPGLGRIERHDHPAAKGEVVSRVVRDNVTLRLRIDTELPVGEAPVRTP